MSAVLETIQRPDSFVPPPYPVRRFTVAEYRSLVESGALEEGGRTELLEGWIVPKVTHKPPHDWTVTQFAQLVSPLLPGEWLMRVQCAVNTEDSEPEPDIAIVHGPNDRYLHRHTRRDDIALLIEVAEASLSKDRLKAAIYAAEGIPVYWIINLVDRRIEQFSDPDSAGRNYRYQEFVTPGQTIDIVLNGQSIGRLSVDDLLPPLTP